MTRNQYNWSFYTPTFTNDPFAGLEEREEPTYAVAAHCEARNLTSARSGRPSQSFR
jgi:hypothetical protein